MTLNWLQTLLYGFLGGLTDILPVSSYAHKTLLLKVFGVNGNTELLDLMIHLAVLGGLYFCCRGHLVRFSRAKALARIPKNKRKRPLDTRTLLDISLLRTMLVPILLGLLLSRFAAALQGKLVLLAAFLFLNGTILYVPQFLPTGNKDARTLSRVDGLLMGLGGGVSVLPGISAVGMMTSVGSICGVERSYGLTMALLADMVMTAGLVVVDFLAVAAAGLEGFGFMMFLRFFCASLLAFGGTVLGIWTLRAITREHSLAAFGLYCFGLSLFTFILNLMA